MILSYSDLFCQTPEAFQIIVSPTNSSVILSDESNGFERCVFLGGRYVLKGLRRNRGKRQTKTEKLSSPLTFNWHLHMMQVHKTVSSSRKASSTLPLCPTSQHRLARQVDLWDLGRRRCLIDVNIDGRCEESMISRVVAEPSSAGGKVSLKRGILDSPGI